MKREITSLDIKNFLYDLAYEKYYRGNTTEALDILSISLKDKYLTKLILNAFTAKERENCKGMLLKAAYNKKVKLKPGVWTGARLIDGLKIESSFEQLNKLLEEQKSVVKKNTRILAQIKLAKAITGDWWQGLELDSNKKQLCTYEKSSYAAIRNFSAN